MIGTDEIVWYHDGMTTGSTCENEGDFDKFSNKKMMKNKGIVLTMVVLCKNLTFNIHYAWRGRHKW